MKKKPIVLITESIADEGLRVLEECCEVRLPWRADRLFNERDLQVADALIVRLVEVTGKLITAAPNLRVIGRHGAGFDNVDLPAATLRGIPVVYAPLVNSNAVAEYTIGLILALARHTIEADRAVRRGRFDTRDSLVGFELRRRIVGIVGYGAIGSRVAELCHHGFEAGIIVYDPFVEPSRTTSVPVRFVASLEELLAQADVVSLHAPLTAMTRHLVDARGLARMKRTALLVNTSRGAVVNTVALAEALRQGKILGAAIDVFEDEPLDLKHPLLSAPRALLSPHIAGSTLEARAEMSALVARMVLEVLNGKQPRYVANPEVWTQDVASKPS